MTRLLIVRLKPSDNSIQYIPAGSSVVERVAVLICFETCPMLLGQLKKRSLLRIVSNWNVSKHNPSNVPTFVEI